MEGQRQTREVSFRMELALYERLTEVALAEKRPRSQLIRFAIEDYLTKWDDDKERSDDRTEVSPETSAV